MANPKLAMIPTGYKAGKVYSVLPESGVGDFTFDRDSKATRVNENGLIEIMDNDVPRLDYTDGGCPSLLLEPERTNLITYSEDFSNSAWGKSASGTGSIPIVTSNYAISPDGTLNASRLQLDKGTGTTSGDLSLITDSFTVSSGLTTNKSIYVKSNTSEEYDLVLYGSSDASSTNVKKIRVTSEWQRFDVFKTISATSTGLSIGLREISVSGLSNTADVLIWGAQLEEGEYPTSYIPTNGSTVTRVGETCNGAGDATTFNDSEGVLMAEISALKDPVDYNNWLTITDGTNANSVGIVFETTGTATARIEVGGVGQAYITTSVDYSNLIKVAFKYKENDFAWWVNGIKVATDSSGITFPSNTLNSLQFSYGSGGNNWIGNTKQIQYFDSALTDAEIEKLTSWTSFTEMANGQNYTII